MKLAIWVVGIVSIGNTLGWLSAGRLWGFKGWLKGEALGIAALGGVILLAFFCLD